MNLRHTLVVVAAAVSVAGVVSAAEAYTASDYVQAGLIGHWDGRENAGVGVYDESSTVWKDLTGISGDFTVNASAAAFQGYALVKTKSGNMATNPNRRTDIRTIEVVASDTPTGDTWVMAVFINSNQYVTWIDGRESGKRLYFLDYNKFGVRTSVKPSNLTASASWSWGDSAVGSRLLQNGCDVTESTYLNYWGDAGTGMSLGGRPSGTGSEMSVTGYKIYAVRFYNRELSPAEAARNAFLDQQRFFNSMPDGYRVGESGELEFNVKVTNSVPDMCTVKVDGTAGDVDIWLPVGSSRTFAVDFVATGTNRLDHWKGLSGTTATANWNRHSLSVTPTSPLTLSPVCGGAAPRYTYAYPKYVVSIPEGGSNAFKNVTSIMKYVSADDTTGEAIDYASFQAGATAGCLVKDGKGVLTMDEPIAQFDGNVHVLEGVMIACCSNALGKAYNANANVKATEKKYVHNGATLVMDAGAMDKTIAFQESASIQWEGEGAPGWGGAFVHRNGVGTANRTYWPWGVQSYATGPSKVFIDMASGKESSVVYRRTYQSEPKLYVCHSTDMSFMGYDTLVYGRTVGTVLSCEAAQLYGINYVTISNLTVNLNGNSSTLTPATSGKGELHFTGGSRLVLSKSDNLSGNETKNHNYHLVFDDLEFLAFSQSTDSAVGIEPWGGQTNLWWRGPLTLNCDLRLYRSGSRKQGFTLAGPVDGPGGVRPYKTNPNNLTMNLMNGANTFKGGIVMDRSTVAVWRNGAIPSGADAGLVSITNGAVVFRKMPTATVWETFTLPDAEFVNGGAVTNGTGRWRTLAKKGTGTLDYNSQMGGGTLDLESGVVKFNTAYRANYEGDAGFEAALPAFDAIKGTAGTLDVANLAESAYEVKTLVDTPSISNADVTVTTGWTVSAAALAAGNVATFSGDLTFGEGAIFAATDLDQLPTKAGGYVFARAKSVKDFPTYVGDKWCAEVDADGQTIRLKRNGLLLFIK